MRFVMRLGLRLARRDPAASPLSVSTTLRSSGKRRRALDRRQRQPFARSSRHARGRSALPHLRFASATARSRSQSKPSSPQWCGDIIFDRFLGQVHQPRGSAARSRRAGRAPASASGRRAQAWRYSTAPPSPRRRLRHWTSRISPSSPLLFGVGHQVGERAPHQLLLGPALDRLEARHDPRFRRKGREQRLGEAVDGLDLQPAGAVEHPREQLPRALAASRDRRTRRARTGPSRARCP